MGKTTVTLAIAESAHRSGLQVLVIDLDPQCNATETLRHTDAGLSVNDALVDGRPGIAAEAIHPTHWGEGLDVLAGDPALEHRNRDSTPHTDRALRTVLGDLPKQYDLVLIDCPPSIGTLTVNALTAADRAVTVTEAGFFALRGAEQSLQTISVIRDSANLALRSAGIIVNRFRGNLREQRERLEELRGAYPSLVLDPVIPERSVIAQAAGAGRPVQAMHSAAAGEIGAMFDALMPQVSGIVVPVKKKRKQRRALSKGRG